MTAFKHVFDVHDIYQCLMHGGKLLMMGRGTSRNM
jgi:phosphoheptose isomerase